MALTESQNIPNKPEKVEPWTFKRLVSFGAIKDISKIFTTPFEILLGFLILVFGINELISDGISLLFWILIMVIIGIVIFERHKDIFINETNKKQLKKK